MCRQPCSYTTLSLPSISRQDRKHRKKDRSSERGHSPVEPAPVAAEPDTKRRRRDEVGWLVGGWAVGCRQRVRDEQPLPATVATIVALSLTPLLAGPPPLSIRRSQTCLPACGGGWAVPCWEPPSRTLRKTAVPGPASAAKSLHRSKRAAGSGSMAATAAATRQQSLLSRRCARCGSTVTGVVAGVAAARCLG